MAGSGRELSLRIVRPSERRGGQGLDQRPLRGRAATGGWRLPEGGRAKRRDARGGLCRQGRGWGQLRRDAFFGHGAHSSPLRLSKTTSDCQGWVAEKQQE